MLCAEFAGRYIFVLLELSRKFVRIVVTQKFRNFFYAQMVVQQHDFGGVYPAADPVLPRGTAGLSPEEFPEIFVAYRVEAAELLQRKSAGEISAQQPACQIYQIVVFTAADFGTSLFFQVA